MFKIERKTKTIERKRTSLFLYLNNFYCIYFFLFVIMNLAFTIHIYAFSVIYNLLNYFLFSLFFYVTQKTIKTKYQSKEK